MTENIIIARKLTKIYKLKAEEIFAVKEVDLNIKKGEFISIMGPSGSGKTTLLDSIGCLVSITSGSLKVLDQDVSKIKERKLFKIRRKNFGFIFQDFLLIETLTAIENLELVLKFVRKFSEKQKLIDLLEKLGLGHRINHLPNELSGGEKQRVAIARALAVSPKILIADEPTGNLDSKTSQDIFDLFRKLNKEEGLTIIVATHNKELGEQADRIVCLKDGRVNV